MELAINERYSFREMERQLDSGCCERYILSAAAPSAALVAKRKRTHNVFRDNNVLEFLDVEEPFEEKDLRRSIVRKALTGTNTPLAISTERRAFFFASISAFFFAFVLLLWLGHCEDYIVALIKKVWYCKATYYSTYADISGAVWLTNLNPINAIDFSEIGCYTALLNAETGKVLQFLSAADGRG